MAREVLHRVCHGTSNPNPRQHLAFTVTPAILHSHCRHRVKQADYPGMIAEAGHSVRGTYVTGLNDLDIVRLDYFEGAEYERRPVKVVLLREDESEGEVVATSTYIYTAGEQRLEKREWDFEEFKREKMRGRWSDDGEEFEGVNEAGAHDPTGGRAFGGDMDKVLRTPPGEREVLESAV